MRSIKAKLQEHVQADLEDYADHYVIEYDQVRQEIGKDGTRQKTNKC